LNNIGGAMDWSEEFRSLSLGDPRLDRRFHLVFEKFLKRPGQSIAAACGDWTSSKGAYRLLGNKKFSREKIMELHRNETIERMSTHEVVLAIQDTSMINYNSHINKVDLGPVGSNMNGSQGLILHTLLAVTPEMEPLGILDQKSWVRSGTKKSRSKDLESRESYKWIESLKKGSLEAKVRLPKTQVITVSDRESDISAYLGAIYESEGDVVVRARGSRIDLLEGKTILESFGKLKVLGEYDLEVTRRYVPRGNYKRKNERLAKPLERIAHVEIRGGPALLRVKVDGVPTEALFYCVLAKEKGCHADPIEWVLITTLPAETLEEAVKIINYYKVRWFIEIFHRTLKSGCGVEDSRLKTRERLQNYLLMMSLAAVKICKMTYLHRNKPGTNCEELLTKTEWEALYIRSKNTKRLPSKPPSVQEVTLWIAKLGGFLARKNDGYPGTLTLWKGLLRLHDMHENYLFYADKQTCG
jgi:hypothetical protein